MGDDPEPEADSLAQRRGRRSRTDKSGRLAALEALRNQRTTGTKNKYQVSEVKNVYDVVDEGEYSKKVSDRQRDDWIIDDGSGYYEDGREIFDDDIYDEDDTSSKGGRKTKTKKDKKDKEAEKAEKESHVAGFQNIRNMLVNMPVKRKRPDAPSSASAAVDEDALMSDFMAELHNDKKSKSGSSDIMKKLAGTTAFDDPVMKKPLASKFVKPPELKKFKPSQPMGNYNASPSNSNSSSFSPSSFAKKDSVPESKSKTNGSSISTASNKKSTVPQDTFPDPMDDLPDNFADDFLDSDFDDPVVVENGKQQVSSVNNKNTPVINKPTIDVSIVKSEPVDEIPQSPVSAKKVEPVKNKIDAKAKLEMVDDISKYCQDDIDDFDEMDSASADLAPSMENKDESGGKTLNFYWLDLYEEPKTPGIVYLFGKVKPPNQTEYASCCVIVKNLTRCVFLLPREKTADGTPVKFMDVYREFNDSIGPKYKINEFKSKKVEKNYCFDLQGVPAKAEYLEVRYSGSLPPLPVEIKGETFSRAFGTTTPLMETFLLEKQFKGPSWLTISNYEIVESVKQVSWSKFEFTCDVRDVKLNPQGKDLPPPPLVLVSLNLQAVNDATTKKDTIIFAGVAVNKSFLLQSAPKSVYNEHFCLLNKPPGEIWPLDVDRVMNKRTIKMDSERSMLGCLLAKLHQIDADVYLGHDLNMELLILHLLYHKVPHWSRVGRLKRSSNPVTKGKMLDIRGAVAGRLLCDVKISAMELIRARSYDLPSLGSQILGMKEEQIATLTGPEMKQLYDSSEGLINFKNWGMQHCVLNIRLINELQVMPLAVQITSIAGNTLSRTLLGGRSERNEFLLLHAFHQKNYIVPDKYKFSKFSKKEDDEEDGGAGEENKGKKGKSGGPSYSGGLVLAPKKGFYDHYVVLMDFNSLYPSIIQEFNVCFTTAVDGNSDEDGAKDKPIGILPEEISRLVESRKAVKGLMKGSNVSEDLMRQYDIRQKALKLTANSMYGCLGFRNSRFYAKNLAAYITGKGRDILMNTKDAVEKMGFEVIYGDTDSLMINSNSTDIKQVYQIGNKIKADINKMYKLLELEIDGIFRFLLLLKKKKYAALLYNPSAKGENEYVLELKGLDIVRRDWAPVGANTAKECLNEIMTEQPLDDKIYKITSILEKVSVQLREGNVALKDLLITKQLAKNPEEYKDGGGQYHVQVALRMNKSGNLPKKFRNGDTVSYLFCTDGLAHHLTELGSKPKPEVKPEDTENPTDEATPKAEVKEEEELRPDPEYYLAHQVHPVVSRICDPIPGLDPARIAEALGLDPTSYKKRRTYEDSRDDNALGQESEADKYTDCEKFSFPCFNPVPSGGVCGQQIVFESVIKTTNGLEFALETPCPNCQNNPYNQSVIKNHLTMFMRKFIVKYYKNIFTCEDPSCSNTMRIVPFSLERGYPVCPCKQGLMCREYTDAQLYRQLNYLSYIFNINQQTEELSNHEKEAVKQRLSKLKARGSFKSDMEIFCESMMNFVLETLNASGYSDISLKNLFGHCSAFLSSRKALRQAQAGM